MTQYRKKPVAVEAVQFNGLNPTEIKDFVGENCVVEIYDNEVTPPVARIVIHTLEGDMKVSDGDYIIKGVKGEFYPCKPDIFEQTYESVETHKEQPSLPSDIDEAAEKYSENILANNEDLQDAIEDAFKAGAEWMAGRYEKIEGDLVDWYSTSDGKDYCCGVKTIDAFEVPEGFYIRKKQ